MKRLWVQQTLAFSVVIIVIMSAAVIWINQSAVAEFRKYITRREVQLPASTMQELVAYYQRDSSWEGVERLIGRGVHFGKDGTIALGAGLTEREWMDLKEQRKTPDTLLVDSDGRIVFDSSGKARGKRVSRSELDNAWPITTTDDEDTDPSREPSGYLVLFYSVTAPLGKTEQQFLDRVEWMLFAATALAVISMLVLGALLSRRLNAPLQRLAAAARAVAAGDLGQEVETGGSVEVAEVGQAFNDMTSALKAAQTSRQNMVADVAHELRTPLSVLQGNLWAILNDTYPLEKQEIARLYDETRLLSRLVEDLRELALADAEQLNLNLCPTDVALIIHHTLENFGLAAEAQQVCLSAQLEDLAPVRADADRVAQVLRNLLVNALRHTPSGGSVTVSARTAEEAVEIAVADTGVGIAAEDVSHVFERFWRADPARSRGSDDERWAGGTGLGLAVAQSLVEAQGGRIWVESTLGKGAVFRFTLPLVQPPQ